MYRSKRKSNLFIRNSDGNIWIFKPLNSRQNRLRWFIHYCEEGNKEIRERDNKNL